MKEHLARLEQVAGELNAWLLARLGYPRLHSPSRQVHAAAAHPVSGY